MLLENGAPIQIGTLDTSASHTISISGFVSGEVKIDRKYLPDSSPLIIDATNLPTDTSVWGELYKKIDSAYKDRREILLNEYSNESTMLPCVSWYNSNATFIYSRIDKLTLYVCTLRATPNDGGGFEKRIIDMKPYIS